MRRDYFTLDVRDHSWIDDDGDPEKPTLIIDFEGPASLLSDRVGDETTSLDAAEIDVSFRFQTDPDEEEAMGVVSVTDRVTGDYVLELNSSAEKVINFIRSAREYGDRRGDEGDRYGIELQIDGDAIIRYDKRTFLVYTREGNLLREQSLIPSGVEL